MMTHWAKYLTVASCLVVAACSSKQEPLEGTREYVLERPQLLRIDPQVRRVDVKIPEPIALQNWAQTGAYADHAAMHLALPNTVTRAWRRKVSSTPADDEKLLNPPVVGEGKVFSLTTENEVVVLDTQTGKELWTRELEVSEDDLNISGGLAFVGGTLYVTLGTGQVYALDGAEGQTLWMYQASSPIRSAPTVAEGKVFVISNDNKLHTLSTVDGTLLWQHSGIEESIALLGGASPAVSEGVVVVPYSSGELYALSSTTGKYIWHEALSFRVGADPASALVDAESSPVIVGDMVYAVNHQGRLSAFDLKTGRRIWSRELSSTQMPWVAGNMIYVVTDQNELVAVHRQTGAIKWIENLGLRSILDDTESVSWSGPILAGNRLLVVATDGMAASYKPETGKRLAMVRLREAISMPPVVAGGSLYFLTDKGRIISYK